MKKITTATAEQWKEIDELRNRWIDNQTQQYSHDEVCEVVHRMYKSMSLEAPIVLVAPSPMATCVWSSGLKTTGTKLGNRLFNQLDSKLYNQLRTQLYSQLDSQLDSQLYSQLRTQLYNQLRTQLGTQLGSQLRTQLGGQLDIQLGSQLYSKLHNQLHNQLCNQLHNQLCSQLYSQLCSQLYGQLRTQLYNQLHNQLYSQLRNQLHNQLYSQLYSQLDKNLKKENPYVGVYYRSWSGWYAGAKILGVEFDEEKLSLFTDFNNRASCWIAYDRLCIVSQNPIKIHWQDGELHNDSGMSVEYSDGWGIYSINGVAVDEQIVIRPDTQTVKQIREEENEEVKRIRIERYGWEKFMRGVKAKAVDSRVNEVDGTHEGLFSITGDIKTFVGRCRSTGRVYFLEVPGEVQTCEQAQTWFLGERTGNCIGAS